MATVDLSRSPRQFRQSHLRHAATVESNRVVSRFKHQTEDMRGQSTEILPINEQGS